jgi:hypothetical protein
MDLKLQAVHHGRWEILASSTAPGISTQIRVSNAVITRKLSVCPQ